MIELKNGKFTEEIKNELMEAKLKALDEGKAVSENDIIPIEIKGKTGQIEAVGVFRKLSTNDYRDVYNVIMAESDEKKASELSQRLKARGMFQICIDACANCVLSPSKQKFIDWANSNQFAVVNIANRLLEEGSIEAEVSKASWDFF